MEAFTIFEQEKLLRSISKTVNIDKDDELSSDIEKLKKYLTTHNGWALAGIQLGICKRILFICSQTPDATKKNEEQHIIMINPEIIEAKGKTQFWEACFSCFPYCSLVERPYSMKIKYYTLNNEQKIQKFEGFICTVLSHEIDHFDGIFHMDRAIETRQLTVDERKKLREKEPYKIISETSDFIYPKTNKFVTNS